jgi:hypothetical protein
MANFLTSYAAQFSQDPLFGAKFSFLANLACQNYFKTLQNSLVELHTIQSYPLVNDLQTILKHVDSWSLSSMSLPPSIISLQHLKTNASKQSHASIFTGAPSLSGKCGSGTSSMQPTTADPKKQCSTTNTSHPSTQRPEE